MQSFSHQQPYRQHAVWQESLILGFIWAIIGLIFSSILVIMLSLFQQLEYGAISFGLAPALAGAVGALFYGSLRLAFMAAIAALIGSFGYLAIYPMQTISPLAMLWVSGSAGVIVGAHYGQFVKGSRVQNATAKALAGLYSGFIAGIPLSAMAALSEHPNVGIVAAILTPLTGVIYVYTVDYFVHHLKGQPPAVISGALAGGGVAGLIGIAVWAFAGVFNSTITATASQAVHYFWAMLPQAAMGGMISGFVAGAVLATIGVKRPNELKEKKNP
jgi:hypothetical protein